MYDFSQLPFRPGSTYGAAATTDGTNWEGRMFWIPDLDYSTNILKARAYYSDGGEGQKLVRVVRNVSGIAILPRRLVQFQSTFYGKRVIGYSATTAGEGYLVDEFLPTAGCPNNDLCYITVEGPAEGYTSAAASAEDVFSVGSILVALTAAASTFSTTAGRITPQDLTGATALLALQVQNRIGVALSASTTANSNTAKLIYVKRW